MTRTLLNTLTLTCIFAMMLSFTASAQAQVESSGISGTGVAKSSLVAETMRMTMTIEAKSGTFADAVALLAKKQKQATIKLEKLEADEESIKFGEVTTGGQGDSSTMIRQMEQMLGNDPRVEKMRKIKPPITLTIELTADWKLAETAEINELLIACDAIRTKISAADIGGAQDEGELSDEQAELAEEMAEIMSNYRGQQEEATGTPTFSYFRLVSPEDHDKLVAEAFAAAKSDVQRLAKATGTELGSLKMVKASEASGGADGSSYDPYYDEYGYGSDASSISPSTKGEDGTVEATSDSPGSITYNQSVTVVFEIKQ